MARRREQKLNKKDWENMIGHKLETWAGLLGLTLALTGCPGGDDSGTDTNNTTNPQTTSETDDPPAETDDPPDDTDDPPATDGETDDPPATGDDTSTGDPPVTCDPPCAANEECIEGVCFPTGECDPPCEGGQECVEGVCMDPAPTSSDYGPCDMCAPGEMPIQVGGLEGCYCGSDCIGGAMGDCRPPNESTAQATCALEDGMGGAFCALLCSVEMNNCPTGATCVSAMQMDPDLGLCLHPVP